MKGVMKMSEVKDESAETKPAAYMNTWLLLGPFKTGSIDEAGIDKIKFQPREGALLLDKKWEYFDDRLFCRNYDDYQDLYAYYHITKQLDTDYKTAFAHIYIFSSQQKETSLRIGANDRFIAWINYAEVGKSKKRSDAQRDKYIFPVCLNKGWNSLLIRIDNIKYSWGFYARFADESGNELEGIEYSLNGGSGPLEICTEGMPVGYKDWPYVWMKFTGENPYGNAHQDAQASEFRFMAQGGKPPYRWVICESVLPPRLKLNSKTGEIDGKPDIIGAFVFSLKVIDEEKCESIKKFSIEVRERPNMWFEKVKLGGLCHGADRIKYVQDMEIEDLVELASKQGYQYICPESNHWVPYFWPAPGMEGLRDYVKEFENAAKKFDMILGIYFSNYGGWKLENDTWIPPVPLKNAERFMYVEDLIKKYDIKLFWFDEFICFKDWQKKNFEFDALFSMIKTHSCDTLVINNGYQSIYGRGDIDIIEAECMWGEFYWNEWPKPEIKELNPKAMPIENWRYPHDSTMHYAKMKNEGDCLDWMEWLRVIFSIIGESHIACIEHTPSTSSDIVSGEKLLKMRKKIADWMNPGNNISMIESVIGTQPLDLSYEWGYLVFKEKNLYLYILSNPRGKTGLTNKEFITINVKDTNVNKAFVMNSAALIDFIQTDDMIKIAVCDILEAPAVTVIKLETDVDFCSMKNYPYEENILIAVKDEE